MIVSWSLFEFINIFRVIIQAEDDVFLMSHSVSAPTSMKCEVFNICCCFVVVVSVWGSAYVPRRQPYVGDCGQISREQVLHSSDRHQAADEVRQRAGAEVSRL